MDNAHGLCFILLFGLSTACEHSPAISISPLHLEGLVGSCLQIPCHFRVNEGHNFTGLESNAVWISTQSQFISANSAFVVYNKTREVGRNYPMEIIGDLKSKDCTTVFNNLIMGYTDKYFFRVEDGEFRSTASCDHIEITIRDSPWPPLIEVSGEQTEGEVVTITCSAVTPCPQNPPGLSWDPQQQENTGHSLVENPDGTFITTITHKLTLMSSHNGSILTCTAAYPVKGKIHPKYKTKATITFNVAHSESAGHVIKWLPAVCVIILIALIGGVVYIWCVKFRPRNIKPAQVQILEDFVPQDLAQNEDGLHYGDLSFSHSRDSLVAHKQEETVYSQVKVSNNNYRQATEMTDIYAQVKK